MRISVIGLGKLGAPLAAVLADADHVVTGIDLDADVVARVNAGKAPVLEPDLQALMDRAGARLAATTDFAAAIPATDATFIIVPTPTGPDGLFANTHVLDAVERTGAALRGKQGYHLVVVTSTVVPGSMDGLLRPRLEATSGRRVGPEIGLCYNPEFIALGSVIANMRDPDFVLIGESDARAGDMLAGIHASFCVRSPAFRRMSFVNAELAKIAVNTFVTTKISYANMLADICDRLPGADVDVVTAALGSDSRIGAKYLRGGLGYGGPCFPRDNVVFANLARNLGARADIAEATDRLNRHQIDRLSAVVEARLPAGGTLGILGLSYKPDTWVIEESQGVMLAERFLRAGREVVVYDPQAMPGALAALGEGVHPATGMEDCLRRSDVVVLATAWPAFREFPVAALKRDKGRVTVIDCWHFLPENHLAGVADLVILGRGPRETD